MGDHAEPVAKPADPETQRRAAASTGAAATADGGTTPLGAAPGITGIAGLSGHAGRDRLVLRSVQRKAGNAAAVTLVASSRRGAPAGPPPTRSCRR